MIQSLKKKSHSEIPLQPRMLKSERTVSQRWQECGTTGILIYCGGGGGWEMVQSLWKTS